MSFTISPNMNLIIPTVGVEAGPLYATDIDNSLTIIDQHNHSSGSGVQITPSGLNISSDLTFLDNNATFVRSIRFQPQVAALPGVAPDLTALYVSGSDLYYNDAVGNQVRITQSGSVTGAAGTITGLPNGTASASYAAGVFTFQGATATAANMDFASAVLRNSTASSFGLTLSPPNALANDYTLTLPALPVALASMTLDTSGNMGTLTFDQVGQQMTSVGANAIGSQINSSAAANPIAAARTRSVSTSVGLGGVASGGSTGTFSTSTQSTWITAGGTITIQTSGRPVQLSLNIDSAAISGVAGGVQFSSGNTGFSFRWLKNGATSTGEQTLPLSTTTSGAWPLGSFGVIDYPNAGTFTYEFQINLNQGPGTLAVRFGLPTAYEL